MLNKITSSGHKTTIIHDEERIETRDRLHSTTTGATNDFRLSFLYMKKKWKQEEGGSEDH